MTETERLVDLMDRAFSGPAWHGPAVLEVLKDIPSEEAAAHPLDHIHSIWELVLHMATWKNVARWRLEKIERVPTDEENFPPVIHTDTQSWKAAIETLKTAHAQLREAVVKLDPPRLDEEIPAGGGLSHFVRLNGVIHHDLYHAGQIALLKKILG